MPISAIDMYSVSDRRVEDLLPDLEAVAADLHSRPEIAYSEHFACETLTDLLERGGMSTQSGICDLPTSFIARSRDPGPGPVVAMVCEYDALRGIGHACGHNLIAAISAGAGLAAGAAAGQGVAGEVVVIGTPAEEGGGGKILMAERGAFDQVDVALMVHPADRDLRQMDVRAVRRFRATVVGAEAHAAASPEFGRNALDGAVLGYMSVAALRQHLPSHQQVHGVILEGGQAANVIPGRAVSEWYVRAPSTDLATDLEATVRHRLRAGADSAGCGIEFAEIGRPYDSLRDCVTLSSRYVKHAESLGRIFSEEPISASTDMGNLSQIVPSIHPMISVAPLGTALHSREFLSSAGSDRARCAISDGAKALARTAIDFWLDEELRSATRSEFERAT